MSFLFDDVGPSHLLHQYSLSLSSLFIRLLGNGIRRDRSLAPATKLRGSSFVSSLLQMKDIDDQDKMEEVLQVRGREREREGERGRDRGREREGQRERKERNEYGKKKIDQ